MCKSDKREHEGKEEAATATPTAAAAAAAEAAEAIVVVVVAAARMSVDETKKGIKHGRQSSVPLRHRP